MNTSIAWRILAVSARSHNGTWSACHRRTQLRAAEPALQPDEAPAEPAVPCRSSCRSSCSCRTSKFLTLKMVKFNVGFCYAERP